MSKITEHDVRILQRGAAHPDGVIALPMKLSNFDKPERRMAKLVEAGLATANIHGDWYITGKGRDVARAGGTE
jgi:hypothetical protein